MRIEQVDLTRWADALPGDGFEPFHTAAALDVLDRHVDGELMLYVGFEDGDPVGLLPAFRRRHSLGTVVLSPPPGVGVPRLGPVLRCDDRSPADRASVNREFVDRVVESIGADSPLTQFRTTCPASYADPRPFERAKHRLSPSFTHRLSLADRTPDDLRAALDDDLRAELLAVADGDASVTDGGAGVVRTIHDAAVESGDEVPLLDRSYVRDLVDALGDRARIHVGRNADDRFLAGLVVLAAGGVAYPWLVGATEGVDDATLRYLHWRAVADLATDGAATTYDLLDASDGVGSPDWARFGATVEPHYVVESPGKYIDDASAADTRLVH